jgi:serine/threonine protein kinase
MGMAEIRDAFEAYASGELAEYELRSALRAEIQTQPGAVSRYAAMAAALRRRNLISAELEAAVVSDMNAIAGPVKEPSRRREPPQRLQPSIGPILEEPTKGSVRETELKTQQHVPAIDISRPALPAAIPPAPVVPVVSTGSGSGRSASRNSEWDTKERLAEPEAPVRLGLVLRERFELVAELGRGGMGVVYKAIDQREVENKGREPYVAIKVLNEEFKRHPESARALQRESKKAMRLAHPNIVLVRDFDRDRGNVYMVMELLHGTPLDQLVLKQHPKGMPIQRVIDIVSGLAAALSYAHQQGIVHADFKPSNAFLTDQGVVKVLDFGVARVALALDRGESTLFDAGKLNAVSPAYASIEMLVGEASDPRDDIYGLACVTYFLLTGRHPFSGIDAIKARDSALLPSPIEGIADHQWRAIRGGLVFERWERTASVKEFLTQFCTDTSTRANRIASGATRIADSAAKRPWLFAAPVGVLLVVAAGVYASKQLSGHHAAQPPIATSVAAHSEPAVPIVVDASPTLEQLEKPLASLDLAAPDFIEQAVAAAADVKALAVVSPGDEAIRRVQSALQSALAIRVEHLLAHDDLDGTRKLVAKVAPLLPSGATRSYGQEGLAKRQQLAHLLAAPQASQHWADQMSDALKSLSALAPGDDPMARDGRDISDRTFQTAAANARAHQRPDEAREYLAMGLSVNQQSAVLTREAIAIAQLQPTVEPAPAPEVAKTPQQETPPPKAAQPPTTVMDASASPAPALVAKTNVVHSPTATPAAAPAAAAPNAPPQSMDGFVQRARQQMFDGNTAQALDTIAAGRKKYSGATPLKDLEITYDRVEEEFERISNTGSLPMKTHQEWLSEIHTLSGDGYSQIEQMLARTLANDIADQEAAGRSAVVANLLDAGRKLFPEYATLLEQGKAGTQDVPQIAVADKAAQTASTTQAEK